MFNINKYIDIGLANGTPMKVVSVNLKHGTLRGIQSWSRHKVYTVGINDVDSITCSVQVEDSTKFVDIVPENVSIILKVPMATGHSRTDFPVKLKQFPFVSNVSTTGHKLQSLSLDNLIVYEWPRCKDLLNWVYVVLSQVCTIQRLFLLAPFEYTLEDLVADEWFLSEESRLRDLETITLQDYIQPNQTNYPS